MRKPNLQSLNRATFSKKSIEQTKQSIKTNDFSNSPHWAKLFRDFLGINSKGKVTIDGRQVIAREDIEVFLRNLILSKDSEVPFGQRSGYNAIAKDYVGISARRWNSFIGKQQAVRVSDQRKPENKKKGGIRAKSKGEVEIDLVEMKSRDLPKDWKIKDFFLYTAVERVTGLTFIRYAKDKSQKTIRPLIVESFKFYSKMFNMKIEDLKYKSDAGVEFFATSREAPDNPFKNFKVEHTIVRKGASIESRNKYLQSVYHRLVRLKRGNAHSIVGQTQKIVNNTRNRIHKKTPNELVQDKHDDVVKAFNKKRKKYVPTNRKPLEVGMTVRILLLRRDKDTKLDFKSYKGKSYSKQIYKIIGRTKKEPYRYKLHVDGKDQWLIADNIIRTPRFDQKTQAELDKLSSYGHPKKTDAEKKARATELRADHKAKAKAEREKYRQQPRRSTRIRKKRV